MFGYAIEVSNAHAAKVPADYMRRQTLVGAERYVTAELKEYESRVLGAEERIARLEFELFGEVRAQVAATRRGAPADGAGGGRARRARGARGGGPRARATCGRRSTTATALEIVDGRHPVLEAGGGRRSRPTTCGSTQPAARS